MASNGRSLVFVDGFSNVYRVDSPGATLLYPYTNLYVDCFALTNMDTIFLAVHNGSTVEILKGNISGTLYTPEILTVQSEIALHLMSPKYLGRYSD